MDICVRKITDESLMRLAAQYTLHSQKETSVSLDTMLHCGHSPIRTQMYVVEMHSIPSFVSTHFVRHGVGVEHFVQTMRHDRGANKVADRYTPVNHMMFCNAEALINIARKRLCNQASEETQEAMRRIRQALCSDKDILYKYLIPDCVYRGGCYQINGCGMHSIFEEEYGY